MAAEDAGGSGDLAIFPFMAITVRQNTKFILLQLYRIPLLSQH